jgi:hypothetical protein
MKPNENPPPNRDGTTGLLKKIEKKYGFSFPKEYLQMLEQNWMTLPVPIDVSLFTKPGHNYLPIHEMEWYSLEEMLDFEFPSHCQPQLLKLVPFAFNGAGEYWCWATDQGMRVLHCSYQSHNALIRAPDFKSALFRQVLSGASQDCGFEDDQVDKVDNAKALLARYSADLPLILPQKWCEIFNDLSLRESIAWDLVAPRHVWECCSILPRDEQTEIEKAELAFSDMDNETPWIGKTS